MKNILFALLFFTVFFLKNTKAQNWVWAAGFGGKGLERVWDIKAGNSGNIYITGQFSDTLIINQNYYPSQGSSDIFLAKFSPLGQMIWLKTYGSHNEDVSIALGIDNDENCYITGYFMDTLHIENTTLAAMGGWDLFLIKTDSIGNYKWARQIKGTASEVGYGISVTNSGDAYITGWYQDSIKFHNGYILHNYGSSDILVAKYLTNGDLAWAYNAGTAGIEYGFKIDTDESENCFITGIAGEPHCNFSGFILDKAGMFVAKYLSNGTIQWAIAGEGASVNDITVGRNGNGYTSGRYFGNAKFGSHNISSYNNTNDAYTASFSSEGNWLWAVSIGNNGADKGRCVENDPNSNVYNGITFDSTILVNNQTFYTKGASDILIQKFNSLGEPGWGISAGGKYDDIVTDITTDTSGNWIIAGWYSDTCYFGENTITSSGQSDVNFFIAKISPYSANIHNNKELNDFCLVYPNPANRLLYIKTNDFRNSIKEINIYKLDGTLILSKDFREEPPTSYFLLDVTDLNEGLYFYTVKTQKTKYSGKVIISGK